MREVLVIGWCDWLQRCSGMQTHSLWIWLHNFKFKLQFVIVSSATQSDKLLSEGAKDWLFLPNLLKS